MEKELKQQSLWFRLKKLFMPYQKPKVDCNHEWRIYGTRLEEEVWNPIGSNCDWLICNKCGENKPSVDRSNYKIIERRPHPTSGFPTGYRMFDDIIVEIIDDKMVDYYISNLQKTVKKIPYNDGQSGDYNVKFSKRNID